jgi:hypothetical protein
VKKGKLRYSNGSQTGDVYDIPDGIIAHLTRECGGNVHDRHVVDVTSGSFEKEAPQSGGLNPWNRAKNTAELDADSSFYSPHRDPEKEAIPHMKNNWVCYDFKNRRIVPTHYAIRMPAYDRSSSHLKSWLVETSTDGKNWREVAREENNRRLNGSRFMATFAVAPSCQCRFIRLVNIGRNHEGDDQLCISAWEIFGTLIE